MEIKKLAVMSGCAVYKVFFSVFALFSPGAVVKCRANYKNLFVTTLYLKLRKQDFSSIIWGRGVKYAFSNLRNNNVLLVDLNPILYFQLS